MSWRKVKKLLVILIFAGLLAGGMFGFLLSLVVLSVYYNFTESIMFSVAVIPFFIWSFWIRCRKREWYVVGRNFILIYMIGAFLTAMFAFEQGSVGFSDIDWIVIFSVTGIVSALFVFLFVLSEFYAESRFYTEIVHIFRGMREVGFLPNFEERKKDAGTSGS